MSTNSRHIDILGYYVRELALDGVIKVVPLDTDDIMSIWSWTH